MIFLTVGTQLPFPRLVKAMAQWSKKNIERRVIAQVGDDERQNSFYKTYKYLTPKQYREIASKSQVIVAHAGTGSIISALEHKKPLIIMPRKFELNEHRNQHQVLTAQKFRHKHGIYVAYDEAELFELLGNLNNLEEGIILDLVERKSLISFLQLEISK
jgi:UDP-N-acetylglucosamine transferase subunit ALG13